MSNNLQSLSILKRQFNPTIDMIEDLIKTCPHDIWKKDYGKYTPWKQILHGLNGTLFWLRFNKDELNISDNPSDDEYLNRDEMVKYFKVAEENINNFFENLTINNLYEPHIIFNKITNFDVILMQIRHLQYHIGHFNSILLENNIQGIKWRGYNG